MGYSWDTHGLVTTCGALQEPAATNTFLSVELCKGLAAWHFFGTDETLEIFGKHWETLATRCVRQVAHSQAMRRSFGRRWKRRSQHSQTDPIPIRRP